MITETMIGRRFWSIRSCKLYFHEITNVLIMNDFIINCMQIDVYSKRAYLDIRREPKSKKNNKFYTIQYIKHYLSQNRWYMKSRSLAINKPHRLFFLFIQVRAQIGGFYFLLWEAIQNRARVCRFHCVYFTMIVWNSEILHQVKNLYSGNN